MHVALAIQAIHLLEQLQKSRPGSINPFLVAKYCSILANPGESAMDAVGAGPGGAAPHALQAALLASGPQGVHIHSPGPEGAGAGRRAGAGAGAGGAPSTSSSMLHDSVQEILSPGPSNRYSGGKAGIRFSIIDHSYTQPSPIQHPPIEGGASLEEGGGPGGGELSITAPDVLPTPGGVTSPGGEHASLDTAFNISHEADKIELGRMSRDMSIMGLARDTSGLGLDRLADDTEAASAAASRSSGSGAAAGSGISLGEIQLEEEGGGHVVPDHFARPEIMNDLLTHIRRAFLEVVRVSYWRQINSGKLPRKSSAALILLNSIDVALETTHTPGLQDWDEIETHYRALWSKQTDSVAESISEAAAHGAHHAIPAGSEHGTVNVQNMRRRSSTGSNLGSYQGVYNGDDKNTMIAKSLKDYREAQVVYLLTTFIDAHQYAQKRIPYYLGDTETIDTPEEALVVQVGYGCLYI